VKWIYILAVILGTPVLGAYLKAHPRHLAHAAFATGVLMFVAMPNFWVAPIPWPGWPGPVQGLELSFVDGISIAIIMATSRIRTPVSMKIAFAIVCLAALVSTFAGYQIMPAIFYDWQLFRAVLLFVAMVRLCGTVERAPVALLGGLGVGLAYEAILAIQQYIGGADRPGGNLGHSNFLGFCTYFVVFPVFALLLGSRRTLWPTAVLLCGLLIAVIGGSRATMGMFGIGVILTILFSMQRRPTSRKWAFAGGAMLLLLVTAPVMVWAIDRRSEEQRISSDLERESMKLAARMIIADHPLGVGPNQYVVTANTGGYSARAGVPWNYTSRSAPVHNTYYLVTAEFGFLGLIGLVALLATFLFYGFRVLRLPSDDPNSELIAGLLAAVVASCVHLYYEWIFMTFTLHYLFAIGTGMMVGIGVRMKMGAKVRLPRTSALTAVPQLG
jgi:O-antigen ligase